MMELIMLKVVSVAESCDLWGVQESVFFLYTE